ncbi:hypothetical protein FPSE_02914 [Fusarium pseudograminearum CS3096]|uniref:Rhodopsin domain-containing protein n=1 Tax=Fusarium pseudograminearum (strain CS3096) TaxID=1028729 RepID=K3UW91_FUSPC|nr:hypothetical protein FPSE_02914 [Fusarium pseudograminearum CS3096]EKJ76916.1 hypothetical protein FPSE_02914 [Fusarium pseudograminearum CS3096]
MKVEKLATLVVCFVVFVTVSAATSVANEINAHVQATIDASPICARQCLVAGLQLDCALQDEKSCICTSQDFHSDLILCMRQYCRTPAIFALMSAFGQDIWQVNADDLSHALKLFWIDCPFYSLLMGMTKVTIILFYIRLCHVYTRFCQACWAVIVIVCLNTVIFMFLNIFQCTPIHWNWNRFSGSDVDFQCMDLNKLQWSINITNIIFDVVVLALPIPLVWRMRSTFRRKLAIIFMFSLGVVVLVASCLKMRYNILYGHSTNITWDYMDLMVWAGIESSVSIAAPCLPTVRLFLHKVFPQSFGRMFAFGSHADRTLDDEIKEEEEEVARWAADLEKPSDAAMVVVRPRRAAISLGHDLGPAQGGRGGRRKPMTEASRILKSVDEFDEAPLVT